MNGKGSKPRPFSVDQDTFGSNWDKVFKKEEPPKIPDGFWSHVCKHNGEHAIAVGEPCNWCGMKEDGTVD
jgi:hypothetical protein